MEARDYRGEGLLGDWILSGLGVSVLAHIAVFFLILSVPWMLPTSKPLLPMCAVSLLTEQDSGGGAGEGEEGRMSKGNGAPDPAVRSEPLPAHEEASEAMAELQPDSEPDQTAPAQDSDENTVSLAPVQKTVEKPKPNPKPKPKPRAKPLLNPPPIQRGVARSEPEPSIAPGASDESVKVPDTAALAPGEGIGLPEDSGSGKGAAGEGPGAGLGTGAGAGRGPSDTAFGSGNGPRFLSQAAPKYPKLARELGKEGTVLLRLTINERGQLTDVEVLKRAGSGFDEEAVRAVKESRFSPARKDGKPIICRACLPIRFVLKGSGNE